MQFLPFLSTDAFKALRVIKFLTICLNKRPLSSLKIPFSVPSPLLSVWMLAICLFPHCHAGLPQISKDSFIPCRNSHWPKLNLSVTGSCQGFLETSGNTVKPSTELPHPMEWRGIQHPACVGRALVRFQ